MTELNDWAEHMVLLLKRAKNAEAALLHAGAHDSKESVWIEMARKDLADVIVHAQKVMQCL